MLIKNQYVEETSIEINENKIFLCSENCQHFKMAEVYYNDENLYYDADGQRRKDIPKCGYCQLVSEQLIPYNQSEYVRDKDCLYSEIIPDLFQMPDMDDIQAIKEWKTALSKLSLRQRKEMFGESE